MLGRFPSGIVWLSIASSIAGVVLIQGAELQTGNFAALIVVALSIFTAIAMLGLNRLKGLDPRAVVVEHNRRIVRRPALGDVKVNEGDAIELVHFVGGG